MEHNNMVWTPKDSSWAILNEYDLISYYSAWHSNIQSVQVIHDTEVQVEYIDYDSVCDDHEATQDVCDCESYDYFQGSLRRVWTAKS